MQLGVGEVEQRSHFAVTDIPAVGDHDVAVGIPRTRLARVQLPKRAVDLEAFEVEWAPGTHVHESCDTRLDQVRGRSLEGLERCNCA